MVIFYRLAGKYVGVFVLLHEIAGHRYMNFLGDQNHLVAAAQRKDEDRADCLGAVGFAALQKRGQIPNNPKLLAGFRPLLEKVEEVSVKNDNHGSPAEREEAIKFGLTHTRDQCLDKYNTNPDHKGSFYSPPPRR